MQEMVGVFGGCSTSCQVLKGLERFEFVLHGKHPTGVLECLQESDRFLGDNRKTLNMAHKVSKVVWEDGLSGRMIKRRLFIGSVVDRRKKRRSGRRRQRRVVRRERKERMRISSKGGKRW